MTKKLAMTAGTARRAVRNLALLAAVAVAIGARADEETVGGYMWTYQINGDTAENYGIMNKLKNPKEWKHGKTGIIFRHNPFTGKGGL
jgi:hypothetical protein